MNSHRTLEPGLVRYIVETAAYESARSLDLIKAIETTVHVNNTLHGTFALIVDRFSKASDDICSRPRNEDQKLLDPDGEIHHSLETTLENIREIRDDLSRRRGYARADRNLRPEDGVVESFDQVIKSISEAFGILNETNWAIMEHDADLSPRSGKGPFRSAKELIAALAE